MPYVFISHFPICNTNMFLKIIHFGNFPSLIHGKATNTIFLWACYDATEITESLFKYNKQYKHPGF